MADSSLLPKIDYDYSAISYRCLYEHEMTVAFPRKGVQSGRTLSSFGAIDFPDAGDERTYTMGAFVTSLDGKIAFPDSGFGPLVAAANYLDPGGAGLDFWILNYLRASMDAVFIGAGTMNKEPDTVASVYDRHLEEERVRRALPPVPWAVVCSLDGSDIPFGHRIFSLQPVMVNTSPAGMGRVREALGEACFILGPCSDDEAFGRIDFEEARGEIEAKKIPVIVTGEGAKTDSSLLLRILRRLGIERAIVESPSYCHSLLRDRLLDELFLSTSSLYIGGSGTGIGSGMEPFLSGDHPHAQLLSLHAHTPGFLYSRYRMIYGLCAAIDTAEGT